MSTLESSIRLKGNAVKAPAMSGPMPANPSEYTPKPAGKSIADAKALKNAGAAADSQMANKVLQINQKYAAPGYKLNTPGVSPNVKTVNRF